MRECRDHAIEVPASGVRALDSHELVKQCARGFRRPEHAKAFNDDRQAPEVALVVPQQTQEVDTCFGATMADHALQERAARPKEVGAWAERLPQYRIDRILGRINFSGLRDPWDAGE